MSQMEIVVPAHTVSEQYKMGITPSCTLETVKMFHGEPGAKSSNEAAARIRKSLALPPLPEKE